MGLNYPVFPFVLDILLNRLLYVSGLGRGKALVNIRQPGFKLDAENTASL